MCYTQEAFEEFKRRIKLLDDLRLTHEEEEFLHQNCPFLPEVYISYLKQFRFHSECVEVNLTDDGQLELEIRGLWDHTILFEVPLMALISEIYFEYVDDDWELDFEAYVNGARNKGLMLKEAGCMVADFSTRRRRSYFTQEAAIRGLKTWDNFVGTSNVHFAHKYGLKVKGTQAHEWFMAVSVLCGLRHANRYALENWIRVYDADLGIALTDTFGTDAFFADFDMRLAKLFDGVRHDSGDPCLFAEKVINHYKKLRIDPTTKVIVFSDGLNVVEACRINNYCKGKIKCSFGIGTYFSNDFEGSKAMNMVIKLRECNGIPVIKLSDDPGKATGDKDALRVAKWTFFQQGLDNES